MATSLSVLFRVAAGPQVGFGHLARSRSLARALGVTPLVSIRGSLKTKSTAASLGWSIVDATNDDGLSVVRPGLIVVDDPHQEEAEEWVRRARRLGIPVASIHDAGLALVESDLVIDGSVSPGAKTLAAPSLRGPQFAILDPAIARAREQGVTPVPERVAIALGGGAHVYPLAGKLSRALAERIPSIDLHVACGFAPPRHLPALTRGTWVESPDGLASELSSAAVAVVAGGVTLYEACALRVPTIAMPVTAAQHITTRACACRGAAVDVGWPMDARTIDRVANSVVALFEHPRLRERLAREAGRLIDGAGAFRVAERLREMTSRAKGAADAA